MKRPSKLSFLGLISLLLAVGIALILHRHYVYEIPLVHGETQVVWSVEARVEFIAEDGPVTVTMARPTERAGYTV